jgi:hypothetical protein
MVALHVDEQAVEGDVAVLDPQAAATRADPLVG